MFDRLLRPSAASSFFLFGARGTGKSTLLRQRLPESVAVWVDLLDHACIEIKSTTDVDPIEVRRLARIAHDVPGAEVFYLSLDAIPKVIDGVRCLHWVEGIAALGL